MPLLVLICLVAGGFTVLQPAIIDILQLKATTVQSGTGNGVVSSFGSGFGTSRVATGGGSGSANGGSRAAAQDNTRASAVAAAAAVGLDDGDEEDEIAVVRQRGAPGARSRARRA